MMISLSRSLVTLLVALLFVASLASLALAQEAEVAAGAEARSGLSLTVYNQDLALVVERRRVDLPVGRARLRLSDIDPRIEPGSLNLSGAALRVLEQSAHYDLLTPMRLLEASLGKTVKLARVNPATGVETVKEATVLSVQDGLVLRIGDRIETSRDLPGRVVFESVPAGLAERPGLSALVESDGASEVVLSYLTGGLSWQADYSATLDEAAGRLSLTGLVTLGNSGLTPYADADLRLVAGTVNRAGGPVRPLPKVRMAEAMAMSEPADLAPQAQGELYVYDPGRKVSLFPRETKQIVLLTAAEVPYEQAFRFDGLAGLLGQGGEVEGAKAQNLLSFANEASGGLGKPLPAGILRAYGAAGEAPPLFLGEDRIPHTAEGEEVEVTLGQSFDVTGRARQTAFEPLSKTSFEAAQEIAIENAKPRAVTVVVTGDLPPGWTMLSESAPHEAETSGRLAWTLEVPAGGETVLTYRVRVQRP